MNETLDELENLKNGLEQGRLSPSSATLELDLIETMIFKTKQLLVKTVKSVIKNKEFGSEGFLSLSAKIEVHGNFSFLPADCRIFDKNFCNLYFELIESEKEIIQIRDLGATRKKLRNVAKNSHFVSPAMKMSPKKKADSVIKSFMANKADFNITTKLSPPKRSILADLHKALIQEKGFEGFRLDSLFDTKVLEKLLGQNHQEIYCH